MCSIDILCSMVRELVIQFEIFFELCVLSSDSDGVRIVVMIFSIMFVIYEVFYF